MPYTDASALALFLPFIQNQPILTASSFPNMDQAATMIALVSAELDGAALAAGYSVPVSPSTGAWLQMAQYTQEGAGARALRTLLPALAGGTNDRSNYASVLDAQYRIALSSIKRGEIVLVDAARASGTERPLVQSNFTDGSDTAPGPDIEMDWKP